MRISDWSSDVCSSDLLVYQEQGRNAEALERFRGAVKLAPREIPLQFSLAKSLWRNGRFEESWNYFDAGLVANLRKPNRRFRQPRWQGEDIRSEEHTSELQSLMRISYAVICLKKKRTAYK